MIGDRRSTYRCAPTIAWVKDAGQTLLVEEKGRRAWSLRGEEAVVWDLLNLGYSFDRTVAFLSDLLEIPGEEARMRLCGFIREWEVAGIVHTVGRTGCG
jgi:hypothetical protein